MDLKCRDGQLRPSSLTLDAEVPGWSDAAAQLVSLLTVVARTVIGCVASELGLPDSAFLETVQDVTRDEMPAACLRLYMCKYSGADATTDRRYCFPCPH